jgi:hypothetical protein
VTGYPTVWIDGVQEFVGASPCESQTVAYRNGINARIAATEGMSPVVINSSMTINAGTASVSATFRLTDPIQLTNLRGTLLLYEDNLTWCCGYGGVSHWDRVTRKIYDQNVTLTNVGDQATISMNIPIGSWVPANLVGIAYLQSTATKEVIQAQKIGAGQPPDYSLFYPAKVRSVPAGNGTAVFAGQLWNLTTSDQTFTLEPGTAFGDWPSDFLVCGDPNPHTTPVQVTLPPDGICDFSVRVHTGGTQEVRSGTFTVTSDTSGRVQTKTMRVFNGSYSIYLVDNTMTLGGGAAIWTTALSQLGYLYEQWDINGVHGGTPPSYADVQGFDIMIWETGYRTSGLPGDAEQGLMKQFVDAGGNLYFTSQYFLNTLDNIPNDFTQNYLGIASWVLDTSYTNLSGVAGDPIGDGLNLPLSFQYPSFNKGDNAIPNTAVTGLLGNENSNALIHNVRNDSKIVFMPACFNAISTSDPDPNNQKSLLGRVLTWLHPAPPADAPDGNALFVTRIDTVRPNPFNPKTQISFTLSPAGANGSVSLEIFDLGGRKVSQLVNGRLTPGAHVETWDGISDGGQPVESGVYFARLTAADGVRTQKMVLLK